MMDIEVYVCDTPADLAVATGGVPPAKILYKTPPGGAPETGQLIRYLAVNNKKSPGLVCSSYAEKYILVARV